MSKVRRKFVAQGVPGGYRIWNKKQKKYWGELYHFVPEDLLEELNGERRPAVVADLNKKYLKMKR